MVDTTSHYSNQQRGAKKKKIAIIFGVVVIIAVAALVGGALMFRQQSAETETTDITPTITENREPSPTEKPKIDKKSVKIQVLNGTGTPGQAGIAVEALTKAGYNPENITAANAEEFDNTATTITARDGFEDIASDVKDALEADFDEVKIESSQLDEKSEFDIVVVTGGEIFQEATPTATATGTEEPSATPSPTSPTSTPTL